MSVTLDSSLEKLYNDLGGNADNLLTKATGLKSTVNDFSTLNDNFKSSINTNYDGEGKESAMTSLTTVNTQLKNINKSLDSVLINGVIKIQSLMMKINDLKKLKDKIADDESRLSSLKADRVNNASSISSLEQSISANETKFKTQQEEAKTLLNEIKELDQKVEVRSVVVGGTLLDISNLKPGSYTQMTFPASNGTKVKYYIYIPANIDSIEYPSVNVWLHGSGEIGGVNGQGMGRFLNEKTLTPSGIVICPELPKGGSYDTKYLTAVKELTDSVAKTYNADANKISISGHSLGGSGVVRMCTLFPNYFSECLCISNYASASSLANFARISKEEVLKRLSTTNITFIEGTNESAERTLHKDLEAYGNTAFLKIEGAHGIVDDNTLTKKFTINGHTYENGLEFCLAQERTMAA